MSTVFTNGRSTVRNASSIPPRLDDVEELERLVSEPTEGVVEVLRQLDGDIILLGVGGKIGPGLAQMAKRATDMAGVRRRVIGVSRFTDRTAEQQLQKLGIETVRCDLLSPKDVDTLPNAPNVLLLAGMKFGASGQEALTWATNAWLPGVICSKFHDSRFVALSTGNIYGLTKVEDRGSQELDTPAPVGEYAMSCLGRERILEYFGEASRIASTVVRLNYATDLRYGVLVDLAQRVHRGLPIDLSMGFFSTIWQGDANAMILQSFRCVASPPFALNVTGTEMLSVRSVCYQFGQIMGKTPEFIGVEARTALLSNAEQAIELFGQPRVNAERLVEWTADWVMRDQPTAGKPTCFESRDGRF